ncbi:MAG: hypothetical protein JSW38_00400 [Dehalococcoidia bacterium]|nr:MAG: hypothetical protein JSV02_08355 [Dehalococcoidia bacterium]UCG83323.1 MAG: hypothetical protein JSW38_00400 [Dehalococcoidia bacterium]
METPKVQIIYSVTSLLRFLAYVAWGSGLIYAVLTAVSLDYINGGAKAAQFFFGLMITLPSGGLLYGLSFIISLIQEINNTRPTGSDSN